MREQADTGEGSGGTGDGQERQIHPLPRTIVKTLAQQNDRHAWRALVELAICIGGCAALALVYGHPLVVAGCMIFMATRQHAIFVLVHEAAHGRLFSDKARNDRVGRVLGTMIGIPLTAFRLVHNRHHRHLYAHGDPDMPIYAAYPRGLPYLLGKLLQDLLGLSARKNFRYFSGRQEIRNGYNRPIVPVKKTLPWQRETAEREILWVLRIHVLALLAAGLTGVLGEYLLLWFIPMVTILQAILRLRAICEHGAVEDLSTTVTQTRTHLGLAPVRWLFFPFNVNFHVEHHLYPSIPFYHLAAAHAQLQQHGVGKPAALARTLSQVAADGPVPRKGAV